MVTVIKNACRRCEKPLPEGIIFNGREIRLHYCEPCIAILKAAQEAERRMTTADLETRKARWQYICPPLFSDTDISRIPTTNKHALAQVLNWQMGPKGMVVGGPTSLGKTRAMMLLLERLYVNEGYSVRFFLENEFAHLCASMFNDSIGMDWIADAHKVDVLFFDDLGKFKLTERVESELFGIIEKRTLWKRPVLVTMNMTGDQLGSKMTPDRGAPLLRRIREFCEPIMF